MGQYSKGRAQALPLLYRVRLYPFNGGAVPQERDMGAVARYFGEYLTSLSSLPSLKNALILSSVVRAMPSSASSVRKP